MPSSATRNAIRKLNAIHEETVEFNETHPPITKLLPAQADNQRTFTKVGEKGITCSLVCHGDYVPREYDRTKEMVNVFQFGIKVQGFEGNLPKSLGESMYLGMTCRFHPKKVCVAGDERLLKAIER